MPLAACRIDIFLWPLTAAITSIASCGALKGFK
jgi:hypothetical protein